ncbi:helix-turn-helix transcriptional regulator [Gloeobacter morelensis MG652769]|uniref:Helix-turn-helix transcriptional regulator n=2 Tax=Gloeobacter TaxID=33071 RepID=A0ABY3PT20_9CYAN|nr:helix-turn-helix transcriptional regulator [Gloeobacter morelensis MG652769]
MTGGWMEPLSAGAIAEVAGYFRVLAEPTRLKILAALRGGPMSVGQVVEAMAGTQANVSKHLQILLDAGMVSRRAQGTSAIYTIVDPLIFGLCAQVCDTLAARLEAQAAERAARLRSAVR